jgi:hypothetical protein
MSSQSFQDDEIEFLKEQHKRALAALKSLEDDLQVVAGKIEIADSQAREVRFLTRCQDTSYRHNS